MAADELEEPNTLFIRLEGPMQSWGERARWGQRDTQWEPTKSGVIGLLACALGWGSDRDADIRKLSGSVIMGVRVDRAGRMVRDYHTVTGGVLSAEGKVKVNANTHLPETVTSDRFYLTDASFLIALRSSSAIVEQLAAALGRPVWPPFLGRRSCPPSRPLLAGTGAHESLRAGLESWPALDEYGGQPLRLVLETEQGQQRNDNVAILSSRTYTPRSVEEVIIRLGVTL